MAINVTNAPVSLDELGVLLVLKACSATKARSATAFFTRTLNKLINSGLVSSQEGRMVLTEQAQPIIDTVNEGEKPVDLTALASQMRELFPTGEQPGTGYLWRCSVPTAVDRLNTLIKDTGETLTTDEVLEATRRYVANYEQNSKKVRTMRYFIYKNIIEGGKQKLQSDLLDWVYRVRDGEPAQERITTDISNFY